MQPVFFLITWRRVSAFDAQRQSNKKLKKTLAETVTGNNLLQPMRLDPPILGRRPQAAYSVVEVLVAVFLLGTLTVSLFGAFSSGLMLVRLERENLRATQILVQKMETVRLLTWSQLSDTNLATRSFIDHYDPIGLSTNSGGATYRGLVSTNLPSGVPADYVNNMRAVTVTIYWTNHPYGSTATNIVRSRQMQTYVARYGMQNYVFK